ncbi:uncharacterized protein LOC124292389 [Haliotis rubra]|uniref:uncharacterized protein LOC124292389 n=1 Tax=Haliotis rubra TaxID=36100 RepID=UPI001EE54A46|nr:uncharacterized protein LOC124292389 [Haliotis rubra]
MRAHPNSFELVKVLQKLEKTERNRLVQFIHGAKPPPRRRVCKEIDNMLDRLKDQLRAGVKAPLDFLSAVGRLVKMEMSARISSTQKVLLLVLKRAMFVSRGGCLLLLLGEPSCDNRKPR